MSASANRLHRTPAAMVTFYIGEEGKEEEFIVHKGLFQKLQVFIVNI